MHMPPVGTDDSSGGGSSSNSLEWPKALAARPEGWGSCQPVPVQAVMPVSTVWQPVNDKAAGVAASYDVCYQGF
jgi:hypothetical protein